MADFSKQFFKNYCLTTAEIFYHLPDYPKLLQSYIWQDYDLVPQFPVLLSFLDFWSSELDGRLHSVCVASSDIITPGEFSHCNVEIVIQ